LLRRRAGLAASALIVTGPFGTTATAIGPHAVVVRLRITLATVPPIVCGIGLATIATRLAVSLRPTALVIAAALTLLAGAAVLATLPVGAAGLTLT
jgi:hypothetical protein